MSSKIKWMIIGSMLVVLLFIFLIPQKKIVIDAEEERDLYLSDESFEIHWIHSIEKEEWFEVYEVEEEDFILTESHFKTFGAGVPSDSNEPVEITKDGFVKYTLNDRYPDIYLNVSDKVETKIVQNNEEILLYELYEPYTAVEIKVENITLLKQLLGG
ncbi:DUF1850 domain-containing protein [Jeotgalicoccus halotolerans]|uniref:DUF1850 domain-containing protein n=1 Tax=Jeotgalicoccus halotolerans TaxID=157227 RepID=UPI00351530F1